MSGNYFRNNCPIRRVYSIVIYHPIILSLFSNLNDCWIRTEFWKGIRWLIIRISFLNFATNKYPLVSRRNERSTVESWDGGIFVILSVRVECSCSCSSVTVSPAVVTVFNVVSCSCFCCEDYIICCSCCCCKVRCCHLEEKILLSSTPVSWSDIFVTIRLLSHQTCNYFRGQKSKT